MPSQVSGTETPLSPAHGEEHLDHLSEEKQTLRHVDWRGSVHKRNVVEVGGREGRRETPNRSCGLLLCSVCSECVWCVSECVVCVLRAVPGTRHRAEQRSHWSGDRDTAWGRTSSCAERQSNKMKTALCLGEAA